MNKRNHFLYLHWMNYKHSKIPDLEIHRVYYWSKYFDFLLLFILVLSSIIDSKDFFFKLKRKPMEKEKKYDQIIHIFLQKFTEGYCKYNGDLLENLQNITSATACQFACLIYDKLPTCNYFFYNGKEENCQFLSSTSRSCDLIRGTPTPSLVECSDKPSKHKLKSYKIFS